MFSRGQWIEESHFHDLDEAKVLKQILDASVKTEKPVVVFDLDSTLFDVGPRSFYLIQEWLKTAQAKKTRPYLEDLKVSDMGYGVEDIWNKKKVPMEDPDFQQEFSSAKKFWREHFFTHEHLQHDRPMDGGRDFVQALFDQGVSIIYLTGRDVPTMSFGTYQQLQDHGFPLHEKRTRLVMKPKRHHDDIEFKAKIIETVPTLHGNLIASFENEPKNLMAMHKVTPKVHHVFLDTVCSPHPAPAGKDLFKLSGFSEFKKIR